MKEHPSAEKMDIDFQKTMKIIKRKVPNNPLFLVLPMTTSQLLDVSNSRSHSDDCLPELLINKSSHFSVLKEFCKSVGDNSATIDEQRICNAVKKWTISQLC
jgi:transcription termination factor NusB